jgi:hypothetical protein
MDMKIEINFPFSGWTKGDLLEFCYGKHADVDTAIPMELYHKIKEFTGEPNAHRFYVMDYTENKIGGRLVNLKEKFFEKVEEMYMDQLPKNIEEAIQTKEPMKVIPFRFWLDHDRGLTRIVVYSTDEQTARKLIMQAEGCPDSAIILRRA